jgi:hypothetical protein
MDIVKCLHATSTLGDELAVMDALATGQIIADVEAVDAVVFAVLDRRVGEPASPLKCPSGSGDMRHYHLEVHPIESSGHGRGGKTGLGYSTPRTIAGVTDDGLADVGEADDRTALVDDVVRGGEEGRRPCHHDGRIVDGLLSRIVDVGIAGGFLNGTSIELGPTWFHVGNDEK